MRTRFGLFFRDGEHGRFYPHVPPEELARRLFRAPVPRVATRWSVWNA